MYPILFVSLYNITDRVLTVAVSRSHSASLSSTASLSPSLSPTPSLTDTDVPSPSSTNNFTLLVSVSLGSFACLLMCAIFVQTLRFMLYKPPIRSVLFVADNQLSASSAVTTIRRAEPRIPYSPIKVRVENPARAV